MSARVRTVLFVCSQNKLRSPTAEQVFSRREDLEVDSAGTNHDAENPLTAELVSWADLIFVMEKAHRSKLQRHFRAALTGKRVIFLDVPDNFAFMQPELVRLLETKVSRHLPARPMATEKRSKLEH
ncbi:low molecular weight protein tyrosine phosphatase family protein [Sphingomonas sp. PAMC 26617]|uniref:low molecular weight protein tyrosine phosphatase family protein n=1 Tax=Sphingomonas sp. PAMC 26617 TaxID=1112216 RepID=UPI000288CE7F|nr:low molecular weight protein tyrosine phosphatase family protein [Sphingomonas sp. PAMC 26617]